MPTRPRADSDSRRRPAGVGFALVGTDALALHVHSFRPDSAPNVPAASGPAGGDRDSAALCRNIAAALAEFLGQQPPVASTARRAARAY